jgi:hypothetical protein
MIYESIGRFVAPRTTGKVLKILIPKVFESVFATVLTLDRLSLDDRSACENADFRLGLALVALGGVLPNLTVTRIAVPQRQHFLHLLVYRNLQQPVT